MADLSTFTPAALVAMDYEQLHALDRAIDEELARMSQPLVSLQRTVEQRMEALLFGDAEEVHHDAF